MRLSTQIIFHARLFYGRTPTSARHCVVCRPRHPAHFLVFFSTSPLAASIPQSVGAGVLSLKVIHFILQTIEELVVAVDEAVAAREAVEVEVEVVAGEESLLGLEVALVAAERRLRHQLQLERRQALRVLCHGMVLLALLQGIVAGIVMKVVCSGGGRGGGGARNEASALEELGVRNTVPIVDIGLNLTHKQFDHDRDRILARAAKQAVAAMILTGTSERHSQLASELALRHPGVCLLS